VTRSVDRGRRETALGRQPPGPGSHRRGRLVLAAAVPEQDERARTG